MLAIVDEHGNFLVHRVGAEEEVTLVADVLLNVLIPDTLEAESQPHSLRANGLAHMPSSFSSSPPLAIIVTSLCFAVS